VHFVKNSTERLFNWLYKPFLAYPDKTERIVYLLIFLFPIAGMSVRHWITNIFNLLVLISLFTLRKPREPLLKEEKIFLWICLSYFSMFIISSFANGWEQAQTYYLGTELRFIMVIPLYILVRRYSDCSIWFLRGAVLGGYVLFGQAYYDVFIMGYGTAMGVYSKNIIGPLAVLTGFWAIYYIWNNYQKLSKSIFIFILLSAAAAFAAAALSSSRGGYVGFIISALACVMFFTKPRWMFGSTLMLCITVFMIYQNSNIVNTSINNAISSYHLYFEAKDHVNDPSSATSTGVRLEMFRTGLLFIRDNPFVGIGPGNYRKNADVYIKNGEASPHIGNYSHPHNVFVEVASSKGLIGLITVLLLFYYPAYLYIKHYKEHKQTAILGLIHIIAMSAFSLTDHSVILMNNYTSILLLCMAIFLSEHIKQRKDK